MDTLISTILFIFGVVAARSALVTGLPGLFILLVLRPLESHCPGTQAVSLYGVGSRALARAMHHSLYHCNVLCMSELGQGGPIPPIGGYGPGAGLAYPFTYLQIFSNHFLTASTPRIFTNLIFKR